MFYSKEISLRDPPNPATFLIQLGNEPKSSKSSSVAFELPQCLQQATFSTTLLSVVTTVKLYALHHIQKHHSTFTAYTKGLAHILETATVVDITTIKIITLLMPNGPLAISIFLPF